MSFCCPVAGSAHHEYEVKYRVDRDLLAMLNFMAAFDGQSAHTSQRCSITHLEETVLTSSGVGDGGQRAMSLDFRGTNTSKQYL